MTRAQWDAIHHPGWDGVCVRCNAYYLDNLVAEIRNGCLSCLAQAETEPVFDDDPENVAMWKQSVATEKRPRGRPKGPPKLEIRVMVTPDHAKWLRDRGISKTIARMIEEASQK